MYDIGKTHEEVDEQEAEVNRTLFLRGFDENTTEDELYELFLQAGPLEKVALPQGKNMAFITYKHSISPPYAKQLFSDTRLHGRTLNINFRTGSVHLGNNQHQHHQGGRSAGAPYNRADTYNRHGHGSYSGHSSYNQRNEGAHMYGQQQQSRGLLGAPTSYPPTFAAAQYQAAPQPLVHVAIQGYRSTADSREYVPQYVSLDNPHNQFRGAAPVNHPEHAVPLDERRQRLLHQQQYATQNDIQRNHNRSYNGRSRR